MTTRPRVLLYVGTLAGSLATRAHCAAVLNRDRKAGWIAHHFPNGRIYSSRNPHNPYRVAVEKRTP